MKLLIVAGMIALLLLAIWFWDLRHNIPTIRVGAGVAKVASAGFKRQLLYHGICCARWNWDLGTWTFERDGQTIKLKTILEEDK